MMRGWLRRLFCKHLNRYEFTIQTVNALDWHPVLILCVDSGDHFEECEEASALEAKIGAFLDAQEKPR